MNQKNESAEKFRILCLDGGGVRGYLSTLILENIEKELKEPIYKHFDFIVGTSTGAIIASLLAIETSAEDIRKMYEKDIKEIFSNKMKRKIPYYGAKYSKEALTCKAKEYFKDLTFNEIKVPLLITSVDINNMKARLHKSPYDKSLSERSDESLASAVIASCSAPSYFPIEEKLKNSSMLVDGGIVANNPSLIGLIDTKRFHDISDKEISLLSIGTGIHKETPYNSQKLKDTQVRWAFPIIELLMNSQSDLAEKQTEFLMETLGYKDNYLRINPEIIDKVELHEYEKIGTLIPLSSLSKEHKRWIKSNL